jgi:hypothetical protein
VPRISACVLLLSLGLLLSSGCNFVRSTAIPTTLPTDFIPTAIALTLEAQNSLVSTQEIATPIPFTPTPSMLPTDTASPAPAATATASATAQPIASATQQTPTEIPYAVIQILNPGPTSRLISPFLLKAVVWVEPQDTVWIELLGEDGRLLLREVRNYTVERRQQISMSVEIDFEIAAVAEAGHLQISIVDEFNRLRSVNSIDLILLSLGKADVNPASDLLENIVINTPEERMLIQGGSLRVAGLARQRSDQPLLIELETTDGKIVGTRQAGLTPDPGSTHGTYAIDVPYQVSSPTKVLLKIWLPGDRIPGILYLSSVEVLLSP